MDNIRVNQPRVSALPDQKKLIDSQAGSETSTKSSDSTAAIAQSEGKEIAAAANKEQKVEEAVQKLSDYMQSSQRSLQFNYDKDAGKAVITVLDKETQEVIRRIPDEVAIDLARNLNEEGKVSLFNTKV